jgi:hypothetical protein
MSPALNPAPRGSPPLSLPAYAAELAKGRRRGMRPQTRNERLGRPAEPGLDDEVIVIVTDRWKLAKGVRDLGLTAVVIEPGPMYDFSFLKGWVACAITERRFPGLKQQLRDAGAVVATHTHDWAEEEARVASILAGRGGAG